MKYVILTLGGLSLSIAFAAATPKKNDAVPPYAATNFFNTNDQVILPPDLAFGFEHEFYDDLLILSWNIQSGYFLYRNKVSVFCGDNEIELNLPTGKPWNDEVFGQVSILLENIKVRAEITGKGSDCSVSYQGCSLSGYCYPPQKLTLRSNNIKE